MLNLVKLTEYTHKISQFINADRTIVYTDIHEDHTIYRIFSYHNHLFYSTICVHRFIITMYMLRYFMLYTLHIYLIARRGEKNELRRTSEGMNKLVFIQ